MQKPANARLAWTIARSWKSRPEKIRPAKHARFLTQWSGRAARARPTSRSAREVGPAAVSTTSVVLPSKRGLRFLRAVAAPYGIILDDLAPAGEPRVRS